MGFVELDAIWLQAAKRLGLQVRRGGAAYVHYDGHFLSVADDDALDADDTVAQLILHELCHWLIEGPAARLLPDWGLDNTSDRDRLREEACVRLQAHLLGPHGLRPLLYPTTEVRALFESLPQDPLASAETTCAWARAGAARAAQPPFHPVLPQALAATAAWVAGQGRLAPSHPQSGFPLGLEDQTCGECVWRSAGGRCRQSPNAPRVAARAPACTRWQGALSCELCGACCRHAYDSVTIARRDPVVRLHPTLVRDRGSFVELARLSDGENHRCSALAGARGGPFHCTIYEARPRPCRDFQVAGDHCLEARRRVGLAARAARPFEWTQLSKTG